MKKIPRKILIYELSNFSNQNPSEKYRRWANFVSENQFFIIFISPHLLPSTQQFCSAVWLRFSEEPLFLDAATGPLSSNRLHSTPLWIVFKNGQSNRFCFIFSWRNTYNSRKVIHMSSLSLINYQKIIINYHCIFSVLFIGYF